jgi:phosphoribosylformimino-5-aminoimidazole carboxamide ribotide isomerase
VLIIPSIDLLDGKCVRLHKGSYAESTVYSDDPARVAEGFAAAGARWIHLVDLNAARGDGKNNRRRIGEIRKAVDCSLETGGGIRSEGDVEELLSLDIQRLVLGTILVKEPHLAASWVQTYGRVFIGAVDAADGAVRIKGWEGDGAVRDTDLAASLEGIGIRGIIYTSISRDGTLQGPDLAGTNRVAAAAGLPVVLSGGIGAPEDVENVYQGRHRGVLGAVIGKAYYEKKVSLPDLFRRYQSEEPYGW